MDANSCRFKRDTLLVKGEESKCTKSETDEEDTELRRARLDNKATVPKHEELREDEVDLGCVELDAIRKLSGRTAD